MEFEYRQLDPEAALPDDTEHVAIIAYASTANAGFTSYRISGWAKAGPAGATFLEVTVPSTGGWATAKLAAEDFARRNDLRVIYVKGRR